MSIITISRGSYSNGKLIAERVAERVQAAALARGVNVYVGTGLADGVDGDAILLGPPFIVSEAQIDEIGAVLREAIGEVADC